MERFRLDRAKRMVTLSSIPGSQSMRRFLLLVARSSVSVGVGEKLLRVPSSWITCFSVRIFFLLPKRAANGVKGKETLYCNMYALKCEPN